MDSSETFTRRRLLKTGAGAAAAGTVATTAVGPASANEYGGVLEPADNFDGTTADATGMDEVTLTVGAGSSGLLFDPAAVVVDPGTTVYWEWTGEGGAHNVHHAVGDDPNRDDDPVFRSGSPVDTDGVEYDFTFEEEHEGWYPYVCEPHVPGMVGVVVVGEENVDGDTRPFGEDDDGMSLGAIFGGSAVLGTVALLGVAAYREMFDEES